MSATQIEIAAEAFDEGADFVEVGDTVTIIWERNDKSIASYTGERTSIKTEIALATCSHNSNCPCAVIEKMVTTDVIYFSDGSVYAESLDRGCGVWAASEDDDSLVEAITEHYLDQD